MVPKRVEFTFKLRSGQKIPRDKDISRQHSGESFEPEHEIPREKLEEMHERAHRYCFVANTLSCEMRVEL